MIDKNNNGGELILPKIPESDTLNVETAGGQGVELDDHHRRADLRLIKRAVRNKWEIPERLRHLLPEAMGRIALNQDDEGRTLSYDPREQVAAAKVIVAMDAVNEPEQHNHTHLHVDAESERARLSALAGRLRIRAEVIDAARRGASVDRGGVGGTCGDDQSANGKDGS